MKSEIYIICTYKSLMYINLTKDILDDITFQRLFESFNFLSFALERIETPNVPRA